MYSLFPADTKASLLPEEVQALGRYLRKRPRSKKYAGGEFFSFRIVCAPDKLQKSRRYEIGLATGVYSEALKRAGEIVSLLFFLDWKIYSEHIKALALARLFPLADLSDDLGRDREDDAEPGFYGGNAGLPFLICWRQDANHFPAALNKKRIRPIVADNFT